MPDTPRTPRFGEALYKWIDFLGVTVDAIATKAKLKPHYLSSLKRGTAAKGINKPTIRNQERIIKALEFFHKKPITRERFFEGPPVSGFEVTPKTQSAEGGPHGGPHGGPVDLVKLLQSPGPVAWSGRVMTEEEKITALRTIEVWIELNRKRAS